MKKSPKTKTHTKVLFTFLCTTLWVMSDQESLLCTPACRKGLSFLDIESYQRYLYCEIINFICNSLHLAHHRLCKVGPTSKLLHLVSGNGKKLSIFVESIPLSEGSICCELEENMWWTFLIVGERKDRKSSERTIWKLLILDFW